ncbi:cell surface protein [Bacillus sp. AFS098217]|uniref:S-layer homology domain-containing protein n=1 Tax=Bacillus sp. AFS098217 TaxID=2033868 RepID=UPI000BECF12A|nr:S-layer homology domain-containing protein [Bacillus sp. AFS098217]PEB54630.1 cell surface protein [Bacillus sp. AFS098217]
MTNKLLKTATALTIAGTALFGAGNFSAKAADTTDSLKFNDVPADHWSAKAITDLANKKIVEGYGNGVFGFGDDVTREQVAALMFRYFKPEVKNDYKNPYNDVSEKTTMFPKEILALTEMGIFTGDEKGNFRPKDSLTREEMAQVLTKAFKLQVKADHTFKDVDADSWAKNAISALQSNAVTIGTGDNMFQPKLVVSREQYSQFLFNAITKTTEKPTEKPDAGTKEPEKPAEKPDGGTTQPEKPTEKPDAGTKEPEKPAEKPDGGTTQPEKPAEKPEQKPEPTLPAGLDKNLAQEKFDYNPEALKNPEIQKQLSPEAQNILREVNNKYNTNLKYDNLRGGVHIVDKDMYLPAGSIGAQFVALGGENNFKLLFLDNNPATVELTKKWTTFLSGLNLDKEIQETIDEQKINNYEKDNFKIRVGHSTADHTMYVEVEPK